MSRVAVLLALLPLAVACGGRIEQTPQPAPIVDAGTQDAEADPDGGTASQCMTLPGWSCGGDGGCATQIECTADAVPPPGTTCGSAVDSNNPRFLFLYRCAL